MDDIVNVRVRLEHPVEGGLVRDIEVDEERPLAADELDAVKDLGGGVVEVVGDDDLVVVLEQGERGEGANVAGAAAERNGLAGKRGWEMPNAVRLRRCKVLTPPRALLPRPWLFHFERFESRRKCELEVTLGQEQKNEGSSRLKRKVLKERLKAKCGARGTSPLEIPLTSLGI